MNRCRVDLKQWLVWWKGQLRQSTWAPGHFHTLEPPASSRDSLSVTHAAVITMPWDTWWSTCSFQVFCTSFDKLFGNIVSPMNQTWSRVKVRDKAQDPAFSFPLTFLKKKKNIPKGLHFMKDSSCASPVLPAMLLLPGRAHIHLFAFILILRLLPSVWGKVDANI